MYIFTSLVRKQFITDKYNGVIMKVYKFGGASNATAASMINTCKIIDAGKQNKLVVVVSAVGKVTNALEKIAEAFYKEEKVEALQLFNDIKVFHEDYIEEVLTTQKQAAKEKLKEFYTEIEWMLHDKPVRQYDYYYDQIVCCGEMFSTVILYHLLLEKNVKAAWLDVRDLIRTDNNFRDAFIDWEVSNTNVTAAITDTFTHADVVITQGFVGSTYDNESTTLGREGSDFTAAIFANILEAESVTIWKDVQGVMSGDPRSHKKAVLLPSLSYREVIEMAYYGAQVIHPKTIKPLQNKQIPLLVKSFLDTSLPGTVISGEQVKGLPPIVIYQRNQCLISFFSKDFSFAEGEPINKLFDILNELKIKPALTQNAAISLLCCFTYREEKIQTLAAEASTIFDVQVQKDLALLTIRHYDDATIEDYLTGKNVLLTQKTNETLQVLLLEQAEATS